MPPILESLSQKPSVEVNVDNLTEEELFEKIEQAQEQAVKTMRSLFPTPESSEPRSKTFQKTVISRYLIDEQRYVEAWLEQKDEGKKSEHIILVTRLSTTIVFPDTHEGMPRVTQHGQPTIRATIDNAPYTYLYFDAYDDDMTGDYVEGKRDFDEDSPPELLRAITNINETLELIVKAQQNMKVGATTVGASVEHP